MKSDTIWINIGTSNDVEQYPKVNKQYENELSKDTERNLFLRNRCQSALIEFYGHTIQVYRRRINKASGEPGGIYIRINGTPNKSRVYTVWQDDRDAILRKTENNIIENAKRSVHRFRKGKRNRKRVGL